MTRNYRTSIVLLAVLVFQMYIFGLEADNEDGDAINLEPKNATMDEPHRTIKRVPTNYRGKVGVRWRRQNERGGRHKKMSSAHQNGPTFHDESIEYSGEDVRPFGIIFNANNTTSAYRVKEKHNKISKNFRSWREAETHEEQSSENKNVVAKSQEIVSVGIKSKETDKSEEEKEENIGNLGCGGIELCSSELAETTKNQPNSTQKSSPILSNRAHLSSREKRIFFDPTSKRKERLFNHPTNKENASLTEEPLAVKHRGSIIPSPSTTTESSTPHRIEDTSGLNQKKRRILMTLPTAVSTEVFPHTMSYSLYNHFRPIDHEVPQEAIIPFLDFGRKLHSGSPSPSGANSLESSVEQKSRMRTPSTTARAEEDRLHDEMDVTLEKKTVERNNVPKLRVRPRGSSSIAGLFRKATSASAVPLAKRPDLIDCSKISKTNPPLNSDDHKLCPSIFGGSIENNTRTNTSVDSRPSNHKYSDETESVVRSGLKTNPRANHEIVNISHNFDSEFDVKSKIYHYEIEPSSPVAGLSSPPITSQLDFTGKVFTTTFKSSTVPNSAMNISESFFTSPSPSTLISEQEAVINQSGSPDVDFNRETNRSADQDTYKDESIDASSLSSVVTRKLTPNLKTTTESHHSVTNDDTVHVERSYLDSSLLRTTVVQPKSITLETPKLSSPSYQRYNSTSHSSKENGATSAESLIPSTILNETAVDYLRTSPTEAATTSEKTKIEDIAVIQTSATHIPFTEEKIEIIPSMENATSNYSVYESYSPSPAPNNYTRHQIFFKEHLTSTVTPASRSFPPAFNHKTNATAKSSVEDVGPVYPEGLGMLTYVLAVIGMVPLILAVIVVGRLLFGYNKKKVFDGSEYSSEYNRSPLEINGLVTSSPMTTKLPRVPQHLGWEMEKTCGLTIVPTPSTKWEFPREKLRLQTVLGQGNFGQVWKAEADDLSGHAGLTRLVAVKTVKEGASSKEREDLLRELGIMQDLGSHPNVVQLLGCCTEKEPYLLIMEYVMYGKLLSFLRDQRTRAQYYNFSDNGENLSSRDLTVFSYCVARGMDYLVSKGIIHRDLAARNVLVDHNKLCKIADFGMSRNVRDTGQIYEQRHSRGALPIRWMAPESLHYCLFTHKTDVWSFGVLVWEIVTLGLTPYSTMGAREVMRKIRNGYRLERPSHCKSELYQVMVDCWRANPADRPTFAELKKALCALLENAEYEGNYVDLESLAEEMSRQG